MTSARLAHDALPLARTLACQAHAIAPGRFDVAVTDKARLCLIDFLGCALEAKDHPWSRQAQALATDLPAGAAIIGTGRHTAPGDAAFANAVQGHGLVREDMHAGSIGHHGVVVWPTLLALAGQAPIDGPRFLTAAIIGYEAGAQIGRALVDADLARLFRPTGVAGPLGATLAGCYALGLPEDATVSALAIAANTASGLNEWPHRGGSDMYFHPGFVARNAVAAIGLAKAGAYGSETIFEGPGGLFAAFRRGPPRSQPALFAGAEPEIMAVYNKAAPACNFAQTACQAALALAGRIGDPAAIARITLALPEAAVRYPGCDWAGPFERALQAKMSIPFGVAAVLARGRLEEANYAHLDDPAITRLAPMIALEIDPGLTSAFPARQGAALTVTLADGTSLTERLDDVIPASPDLIRARFREAAATALGAGAARNLEALVEQLPRLADAVCITAGACGGATPAHAAGN
jgi:2-methylcitrate dehydratase PrpD